MPSAVASPSCPTRTRPISTTPPPRTRRNSFSLDNRRQSQAAVPALHIRSVSLHEEGDSRLLVERRNVMRAVASQVISNRETSSAPHLQGPATRIIRCMNPTFGNRTLEPFLSQQLQTKQLQTKGEEGNRQNEKWRLDKQRSGNFPALFHGMQKVQFL